MRRVARVKRQDLGKPTSLRFEMRATGFIAIPGQFCMENKKIAFLIPAYGSIGLQSWSSHINLLMNAQKFCDPSINPHPFGEGRTRKSHGNLMP